MKQIILMISILFLLLAPSVLAFESYQLNYVNVCRTSWHYYYCDEEHQQEQINVKQPRRSRGDYEPYKTVTPKYRKPLASQIYTNVYDPHNPTSYRYWRY